MGLRDGLNQKPAIAVVLTIIVLAVAVTIIARSSDSAPRVPQQRYLYDLDSGKLIAGDGAETDASTSRVIARVYSCSSCANEADRYIANLEKPNPRADLAAGESPILIRAADGESWVSPASEQGMRIALQADAQCQGMPRSECYPGR